MTKLLVTLTAVFAGLSTFAQGTINFNNRVTGQVDAPVLRPDGSGVGPSATTQLFLVSGTGTARTYTPIGQTTTFREPTAANPRLSAYVVPISSMTVDNAAPGSQIQVVMRVWEGASYDSSLMRIQSNFGEPITVTLGGDIPGAPTAVPGNLIGLSFIPEPSTITLGILGAAALLFVRRR